MTRFVTLLLTAVAFLVCTVPVLAGKDFLPPTLDAKTIIGAGQAVIQFKPGLLPTTLEQLTGAQIRVGVSSVDALMEKHGVISLEKIFPQAETPAAGSKEIDVTGFYLLTFAATNDVMAAVVDFGFDESILTAEPVYYYTSAIMPNDPDDTLQYWLSNGTHGMKVYNGWDIQTGDSTVIFGNIDSGVNWKHPDLAKNIWVNPGEDVDHDGAVMDSSDMNNVDDDLNGKIDDLIGWDWVTGIGGCYAGEDCNTPDKDPMDFSGHGTFIAGTVAAVTNNSQGIAGICGGWQPTNPGVRMMCLRTGYHLASDLGQNNSVFSSQATEYAVSKGADIINYSFAVDASMPCDVNRGFSAPLYAQIKNALNAGVVVIHAAGNDGLDCAWYIDTIPGVTSVAAVSSGDVAPYWTNYGTWIDFSAAGVSVYSTSSDYGVIGYLTYEGTSFSAPILGGVMAVLKSQQPALTRFDLDTLVRNYGENIEIYNDPSYAGKLGVRPNLDASLRALPNAQFTGGYVGGNVPFTTSFADASANFPTSWFWEFGDGQTSTDQNPAPVTYNNIGLYSVSLTVTEPRGTDKRTKWNSILATADTIRVENLLTPPGITDTVDIPFYLTNAVPLSEIQVPITWKGTTINATLLSVVDVSGTRCSGFEQASMASISNSAKVATFKLVADMGGGHPPLSPGSGMICKLKLVVTNPIKGQKTCFRDTAYTSFTQKLVYSYFTYQGKFNSGCVTAGYPYICGDADGSGGVDISDAVYLISYIFASGPAPDPLESGDANCDDAVDISDAVYLITYIFGGGPAPCASC